MSKPSLSTEAPAIAVSGLVKTFRLGVRLKKVEAVRGITFAVRQGDVFGFLGPNGAGKTTTIKTCMGLIKPTRGTVRLLGQPVDSLAVRARVGYLPEKPSEILDFDGRVFGLDRRERKRRIDELLDRVGLGDARERTLRKFSKGMLQRVGIAQALINDPDLVVLDEPLSGLDPIGRKEIRDIIVDLKARGKTIFFSSHILADIEMICDEVTIVNHGEIRASGRLRDLLNPERMTTEVTWRGGDAGLMGRVEAVAARVDRFGELTRATIDSSRATELVALVVTGGAEIDGVVPKRDSLEDLFVREALATGTGARV
jgi:ABC-2 type transport system ATP-binding protein